MHWTTLLSGALRGYKWYVCLAFRTHLAHAVQEDRYMTTLTNNNLSSSTLSLWQRMSRVVVRPTKSTGRPTAMEGQSMYTRGFMALAANVMAGVGFGRQVWTM